VASDLVFTVKAKTDSAAASFKKLASSISPIKKESDAATKSMTKLGKTKVSPKVDDKQIHKVTQEIKRLQDEMAHRLSLNVNANTADIRRKLTGLRSTLKELQRVPPVTPRINQGPITRGVAALKGKFSALKTSIGQAFATSRLGGFAQSLGSDLSTVGGILGGLVSKLGSFGSAVGGIFKSVGVPVLGAALAGVTALGIGIGVTTVKALSLADAFERNKLQMNVFTHNVETTNELLAQVQKYADQTPFEFPELAASSKMLLGIGVRAGKVVPQLKKIGDVAALSGAGIQQLTTIYQQMTSAGRLSAGDMMQLVNAGVNAWPILAKTMGKSVAEVRKLSEQGKIGAKDIQRFWDALGSGAEGATTALAGTLSGMVSTLKDTVSGVLRDIGTAFLPFTKVIVPMITKAIGGIGGKITGNLPAVIDGLAAGLTAILGLPGQILRGLASVTQGFTGMVSGIQRSMADLVDGLATSLASLEPLLNLLGASVDVSGLTKAATDLRTAAGQTDAAGQKGFDALTTAAGKADAAVKPVVDGIEKARQEAQAGIQLKLALDPIDKSIADTQAKIKQFTHNKNTAKLDADKKYWDTKIKAAQGDLARLNTKRTNVKLDAQAAPLKRKISDATAQLARLKAKKATPEIRAKITDLQSKIRKSQHALAVINVRKANPKINANSAEFRKKVAAAEARLRSTDKKRANPKIKVTSNAAQAAADTTAKLNGIKDETVYIHVVKRGDTTSPSQGEVGRPSANSSSVQVAAPQVSLYVRDEKLADLVDIRVDQRVTRAARIIRRRGVVAL
jgi:tape measure domain-containing protein